MTGSWNDLMNPDGAGRMFILDDFQEAIGEANLLNGFDLNTEDPDELEQSKQTLLDQKENARGFSTNSVQNLVSGSAVLHQAWNGDIVNVRNQVDDPELYKYETCKEGVPVGTDLMCIPITARSPGTAMLFIDWILEPENAAQNVAWNGYPQPCEGGKQEFAKLVKDEPSIDVDLEALGGGGMEYRLDDAARQLWTSIFTEVKAGVTRSPAMRRAQGDRRRLLDPVPAARRHLAAAAVRGPADPRAGALVRLRRRPRPRRLLDQARQLRGRRSTRSTSRCCCARSLYAVATTVLCLAIGYPVAYYIARYGGRYRNALIALLVLPFFVNYLVRTYAWVALLADDGPGQQRAHRPRHPQRADAADQHAGGGHRRPRLRLPGVHDPAGLRRARAPRQLGDRGRQGPLRTPLQTFLHVTLPQTKQGILAGAVLVFLPSVGDFVSAQLLGGLDTYMVGNLIQDQFFAANNWPFGAALTVVMMLFLSVWMVATCARRLATSEARRRSVR